MYYYYVIPLIAINAHVCSIYTISIAQYMLSQSLFIIIPNSVLGILSLSEIQ
jgi:hypothetical protein